MSKNKKLSLVVLLVIGWFGLPNCSRKPEPALELEHSFRRKTIGEEEDEWRQRKCSELVQAAVERVLKHKVSKQRQAIWLELSREALHCGALPDPDFLEFASRLNDLTLAGMQHNLQQWLETTQAKTLHQLCPEGRDKWDACRLSFPQEWRIFKEADSITFLAVQVLHRRWKEQGVLTEEHKNLLKLLLHDVAHATPQP